MNDIMQSYLTKRLHLTKLRPKISSSSKFYDVQEVDVDLRNTLKKITLLQRRIQDLEDQTEYSLNERIEENLKMNFIYHSNAIKGSKLSFDHTVSFLQNDIIDNDDSVRDHLDALGHAAAIDLVGSAFRVGEKVDESLLCGVNDLLTKHVTSKPSPDQQMDATGACKVNHNSVRSAQVQHEMEDLFAHCESSNPKMHPVMKAAVAHYNFTRIHPFQHGNGRAARILMNLILQHHNLPPAIIRVEAKAQYLECLHTANQGNIMPFVKFIATSLLDTMDMILDTYLADFSKAQQIAEGRKGL